MSGDSLLASLPRESNNRHKAGVTVRATSMETSTASPYDSTSGRKNDPESPSRNSTGTTAITLIKVAYVIADRTSTDASSTTLKVDAPLPEARASEVVGRRSPRR